jgi:molecular chaperone GrpE
MVSSGECGSEGEEQAADAAAGKPVDDMRDMREVIEEFRASLTDLTSQISREHDRAQARESVIDRLHSDVERLRAGEMRSLLRPAVTDMRLLRDDLTVQARSVPEAMTSGEVTVLLESYADSVALILERCGVVPVRPVAGEAKFNPRQQQAVGVLGTDRADLDGIVAEVVSDGYTEADTGQLVAPAKVKVYKVTGDPVAVDRPAEHQQPGDWDG